MSLLGIDTEGHPFRPGRMAPPIVCLTFCEDDRSGILVGQDIPRFVDLALDRVIDDPENNFIVGSHIAYDMAGICANYPELTKKVFDAYAARGILCNLIIEKLLDNAEGTLGYAEYNLEALADRYLDRQLDKNTWRLRYAEFEGVPLAQWPRGAVHYAVNDSIAARDVAVKQLERANKMGYGLPDAPDQAAADFALTLATNWGMRTNPERVAELSRRTAARMDELKIELKEHGLYTTRTPKRGKFAGIEQGKKNVKYLRDLVIEAYGGSPPSTPSGKASTEKTTLEDVSDKIPQVGVWLEFQGLEKNASTYISHMWDGVSRPIHARFDVLKSTGRNSSSKPNLHNLPRIAGTRECYEARPGYVYISSDFNSQEMRTWAQVCMAIVGWSKLAERYRANPDFDPHITMSAGALLRIPEDVALARYKAGDEEVELARQSAKIANFGLPGMMGVYGLIGYARGYGQRWAEPLTCPRCADFNNRQAQHNCFANRVRNAWRETWPESVPYFQHIRAIVEDGGGKLVQLYSQRWRGNCKATEAANCYFQGLAADISKAALFEASRRCYSVPTSWLYGCRPVVLVHDEILMEAPLEYAHEAAVELVEVMEATQNKYTPDVPARAGAALMKNWAKKAKAKYDAGGRLIPWN